jgi:hypothetical protein
VYASVSRGIVFIHNPTNININVNVNVNVNDDGRKWWSVGVPGCRRRRRRKWR